VFVLGINGFHGDSSACIVRDGELVAAAEEERFTRVKHWAGFPARAIQYCLDEAGVGIEQVQHVAINQDSSAHFGRKLFYALQTRPSLAGIVKRVQNRRRRTAVQEHLHRAFPQAQFCGQLHHVEHHLCHLASAYYASPFSSAAIVSVDGFGDFASSAWGVGSESALALQGQVYFPNSLGIFYQALTQYLGFPHYGDEYKVMGLAPYGESRYVDKLSQLVRLAPDGTFELELKYFRHHAERVAYEWEDGTPEVSALFSDALEELLGPKRAPGEALSSRHKDIARSVQQVYENAFFHLLNAIQRRTGLTDLALAGGCAMNSVANGKIYKNTRFTRLYVQSAAGDAGGALGAAFSVAHQVEKRADDRKLNFSMEHAYWGPSFSDSAVKQILDAKAAHLFAQNCVAFQENNSEDLCRRTALAIAEGKVVGWFQGRMEWGPRALGNRSILGDPRREDMKDILNLKIKRRESFRPFAPSVLREAVRDWFETDDDVPFMMQVYVIRPERRASIPAVTHVDGTGRLQTVSQETNPLYYQLIDAFRNLTDVPMVLNTSFNENEPVVCTPSEALDCFLRTRMDLLVMGNWCVVRQQP
jgi:carbamoyltransferase